MKGCRNDSTTMAAKSRDIKGFIKNINVQMDLKRNIGQKMDDDTASNFFINHT